MFKCSLTIPGSSLCSDLTMKQWSVFYSVKSSQIYMKIPQSEEDIKCHERTAAADPLYFLMLSLLLKAEASRSSQLKLASAWRWNIV